MATRRFESDYRYTVLVAGSLALVALWGGALASAAEKSAESEREFCRKLLDEVAGQVQTYCDARQLNTIQCLEFSGSLGSVSNDILKTEWVDSLKAAGLIVQSADSHCVRGSILSQQSGDASILLLQCTVMDRSGAELKTFRLRKTIGD